MLLIICLSFFYIYQTHGLLTFLLPSKSYRFLYRYLLLSHNTGSSTVTGITTDVTGTIISFDEGINPDIIARNESLAVALHYLSEYDKEYIARMAEGRRIGLTPRTVEFKRAQTLKKAGMLK